MTPTLRERAEAEAAKALHSHCRELCYEQPSGIIKHDVTCPAHHRAAVAAQLAERDTEIERLREWVRISSENVARAHDKVVAYDRLVETNAANLETAQRIAVERDNLRAEVERLGQEILARDQALTKRNEEIEYLRSGFSRLRHRLNEEIGCMIAPKATRFGVCQDGSPCPCHNCTRLRAALAGENR